MKILTLQPNRKPYLFFVLFKFLFLFNNLLHLPFNFLLIYTVDVDSNWVRGYSVPMHLGLETDNLCPVI